ncbi:hypothetical protein ANANG_G00098020 [Anguilla anguilla]|uniref:Mitochondrial antiviral-signaling protein n=1 Tax=Anguilla anguilla TaxID=7936 RepID=A0A9D3S0U8_ANGAN|nr:hypothetical protein ANANG_G00098020 [Anguilla anguilla]
MTYASEQLFNRYLRPKMAAIASRVKAREIVPHLPCLTQTDREEIEAKREISGNYTAMQHLLDCLKRRKNWPEQFISALVQCEHEELASEIRAVYEPLLGPTAPVAPAANAHPVHIPDPSPPRHPGGSPLQPPRVEDPSPQQQPQSVAVSGEQNSTPVNNESSAEAAPCQGPAAPIGQDLPGASSQVPAPSYTLLSPSLPLASETPATGPAVSPPEPQMSPVKLPVQECNLPAANTTQQPVENSDPTVNQVAANDRQAHPAQGSSVQQPSRLTELAAGADHTDHPAPSPLAGGPLGEDEFLSKPGTLRSCVAPGHRPPGNPAFPAPAPVPEEPYSGNSNRLMISGSCRESVASSGTAAVPSHREPEEDHYDSVHRSLLDHQDVRVNVGHVSESAPVPNHAGQAPRASNEQPSLAPMHTYSPQRDQRAGFPYNLLDNYYVPAAAVAGLSLLMLWKLKN